MDLTWFGIGFAAGAGAVSAVAFVAGRRPDPVFAIGDQVVAFWEYTERDRDTPCGYSTYTAHREGVVVDVVRMPDGAAKYCVEGRDGGRRFYSPKNLAALTAYGNDVLGLP